MDIISFQALKEELKLQYDFNVLIKKSYTSKFKKITNKNISQYVSIYFSIGYSIEKNIQLNERSDSNFKVIIYDRNMKDGDWILNFTPQSNLEEYLLFVNRIFNLDSFI